tara:strand:+ start:152 stop:928 length:777 start_codon:yes stop_codon:yes gene_type:complete
MNKKTNIISKIRELFAQEKMSADYNSANGVTIRCLGDGLKVGEKVVKILQGEEATLEDGDYLLDNGKTITVAAGQVTDINEYRAEEKMADMTENEQKDSGAIEEKIGGDEQKMMKVVETKLKDGTDVKVMVAGDSLAIGDKVEVKSGDAFINAPEGRHETIDGLIIYVDAEGLINELETEETRRESEMKEMFESVTTLTTLVGELKETISKLKEEKDELTEKFNKFSAEPSAETITKKSSHFSKTAEKQDRLKFFGQK